MLELLKKRKFQGNLRSLRSTAELIDFSSNDYLGMARARTLYNRVASEMQNLTNGGLLNGLGSTGSRLLTGNSCYAEEQESKIAFFHGYEAGLFFSCGYMANVGLLSAVAQEGDRILYDIHVHASSYDGLRLSKANCLPWRHNDIQHLQKRLKAPHPKKGKTFVCIESVYSMDGTKAPLEEICQLCSEHEALLIVDEAHALGVFGPQGSGLVREKGLARFVFAQVNTFGKALGVHGAIVLGSDLLKQYLINFSRPCIYTTALPLHALVSISLAYEEMKVLDEERINLQQLIRYFCLIRKGEQSSTPIQPVKIGDPFKARELADLLRKGGFNVSVILSPTVPRGQECLRICLHAFNTLNQIDQLVELLNA